LNTYNFFALYANIDGFDPTQPAIPPAQRPEIDRWILSRLYSVVSEVNRLMDDYDMTRAARLMADFVLDEVSNWYVRRNRRRFWKSEMGEDKLAAYQTLYEVLLTLTKLLAPFVPFVSEELYRNLRTDDMPVSVHLCDYPQLTPTQREHQDKELEFRMEVAQQVVGMVRALRNQVQIKVRQPLAKLVVASQSASTLEAVRQMRDIILEEINVKQLETTDQIHQLIRRRVKPRYRTLGPRVGKFLKNIEGLMQDWTESDIQKLESEGKMSVWVDGEEIIIERSDVEIVEEAASDLAVLRERQLVVGLDTQITPELEQEGLARDFVNRIQNLRKSHKLSVTDRIRIFYQAPDTVHQALQKMADYIKSETLAVELKTTLPGSDEVQDIALGSQKVQVAIQKVES